MIKLAFTEKGIVNPDNWRGYCGCICYRRKEADKMLLFLEA